MHKLRKRILMGILSGQAFEDRREACRRTWLADVSKYEQICAVFVTGDETLAKPRLAGDTLFVPCPDSYDFLVQKTHKFIVWMLEAFEFEHIFKCDDDTYVSTSRLMSLDLFGRDYIGRDCCGFAQGGAGYFLSRRAAEIVARELGSYLSGSDEDQLVGRILKKNGIVFSPDSRFRSECRRQDLPRRDNTIITAHHCNPRKIDEIHSQMTP